MKVGRPTVAEALALAQAYVDKESNSMGGSLHIVLHDRNVEDTHVQFCIDWADREADIEGSALARVLFQMTKSQRYRVAKRIKW